MEDELTLDVLIYPENKGKGKIYSITTVQVPNVVTQGKTINEAKKNLKEALMLYFESAPWEKERAQKYSRNAKSLPVLSQINI